MKKRDVWVYLLYVLTCHALCWVGRGIDRAIQSDLLHNFKGREGYVAYLFLLVAFGLLWGGERHFAGNVSRVVSLAVRIINVVLLSTLWLSFLMKAGVRIGFTMEPMGFAVCVAAGLQLYGVIELLGGEREKTERDSCYSNGDGGAEE